MMLNCLVHEPDEELIFAAILSWMSGAINEYRVDGIRQRRRQNPSSIMGDSFSIRRARD